MKIHDYLGPRDWNILERISLIEVCGTIITYVLRTGLKITLENDFELTLGCFHKKRVYPCSSFWNAFSSRWNESKGESCTTASDSIRLQVLHPLHKDFIITCGDIDGVVLGSWTSINGHSVPPEVDDDSSHAGYWTAAAVWFNSWDQISIDRVSHLL